MSRISAMPSGVSVAGLGRRFVAALIDALPIGAISGGSSLIVTLARPSATNMIVLSIVIGGYAAWRIAPRLRARP